MGTKRASWWHMILRPDQSNISFQNIESRKFPACSPSLQVKKAMPQRAPITITTINATVLSDAEISPGVEAEQKQVDNDFPPA